MSEDSKFTINQDGPAPLLELAAAIEDTAAFLANSWWRRTLINFAGGGKLVVTKPRRRDA